MKYPSIFNDVIGPVMRGPSSSHCAAALRIGRLARDLLEGEVDEAEVRFDVRGALATTHESQGSDMGLLAGLLGWEATEERLPESVSAAEEAGIAVRFLTGEFGFKHPGTYGLVLRNKHERHTLTAISPGGGMIEIVDIDDFEVSIAGDFHEILVFSASHAEKTAAFFRERLDTAVIGIHKKRARSLVEIKTNSAPDPQVLNEFRRSFPAGSVKTLQPVLPVLTPVEMNVPFLTAREMLQCNAERGFPLWELAVRYEKERAGISGERVFDMMKERVEIMERSIRKGIEGTDHTDRILGAQSPRFLQSMEQGRLLDGGMLNRMILYSTALMEVKSSLGVIVAAPTAGSCGGLPGACIGAAHFLGLPLEETVKAMLAASVIGVFIASGATFAAEVGGCQAECGAGSAMAAAGLTALAGGSVEQSLAAASMALQNVLGMICDPVALRVEVPCLGKNGMAAANALVSANMALAGFDPVIPLDEVIETMDRVGKSLPMELRCTALGGLSITPASKEIEAGLKRKKEKNV